MDKERRYEHETNFTLDAEDNQSNPEQWQPIETPLKRAARGHQEHAHVTMSSDLNGMYNHGRDHAESGRRQFPHDGKNQNSRKNESTMSRTEGSARNRWDMNRDPYEISRSYNEPNMDVSRSSPRQQSDVKFSLSNNKFNNQLKDVNVLRIIPTEDNYTRNRWNVNRYQYQFPRSYNEPNMDVSPCSPRQPSDVNFSLSNNQSNNQLKDDNFLRIVPNEDNYTRDSKDMNRDPCKTPGSFNKPTPDDKLAFPTQPSAINSPVSNNVIITQPCQSTGHICDEKKIPNYTCFSVFVILCCCPCVGICALINARDARTKMAQGNIMEALKTARTARNLNIAGLVIGLVIVAFLLLLQYVIIPYIMSNKS
ncbi:hypothetical protein Btru_050502 [Bulinus truncatus]|nr:hypothetical protein Btru_050502 [Bulinus truncatus]